MRDLVSVLMPTYNHSRYVREAIESILNQTYSDIELIIINDCSPDNTEEIVFECMKEWDQKRNIPVKYYRNQQNLGITKTLNFGLKMASGNYISILASDDAMLPRKTERQFERLASLPGTVGLVYSDFSYITEDGLFLGLASKKSKFKSGKIFCDLFYQNTWIPLTTALIRRDVFNFVGCFDESYPAEDLDICLRITNSYEVQYIPEPLVLKRIVRNSLGSFNDNLCAALLSITEKAYLLHKEEGLSLSRARSVHMTSFSHWNSDVNNVGKALFWQYKAGIAYPYDIKRHFRNALRVIIMALSKKARSIFSAMQQ